MYPYFKLLAARMRMSGHVVTGLRRGGALKFFVVMFFGIMLIGALFGVMRQGFYFLRGYPEFQSVIVGYMFSMYFLTMILMLTFSNAVISFGGLFRAQETRLLMSMPLEPRTIYSYKATETLMFSSWAFMVLGGPLLAAYGMYGGITPVHWSFYPASALLMIPFIFIPAAAGSLISMLLTRFFPRRPGKALGLFFALSASACLIAGAFLTLRAGLLERRDVLDETFLEELFSTFSFSQNVWSPNFWISEGILASSRQDWSLFGFYLVLLSATALFVWMISDFVAEKIYAASFSRAAGSATRRLYRVGGLLDRMQQACARFAPITARLVAKDIRTFSRDPVQWSQVLVFFGLLFIYVANLRNLGYQRIVLNHIQNLRWTNFVSFANLAAAGLTLATLTTRFVFPMISIEGKRFWVLSLLPIRRSRLLLGKYVFALGGSLLLIVPLVLIGAKMLGTPPQMAWIHVLTALGMCMGLPGIAVGMGAIFPNYREETPAKVVSGFGGTLCLVLSIAFVGLLVFGVGLFCRESTFAREGMVRISHPLTWAMVLTLVSSVVAAVVPLVIGCRAINRAEL